MIFDTNESRYLTKTTSVSNTATFYFSLRILSISHAEDVPTFRRTLQ